MKLEVHEDVYERLVEYVRQTQPQYSDTPSQAQLTTALNDMARRGLDQEENGGG